MKKKYEVTDRVFIRVGLTKKAGVITQLTDFKGEPIAAASAGARAFAMVRLDGSEAVMKRSVAFLMPANEPPK